MAPLSPSSPADQESLDLTAVKTLELLLQEQKRTNELISHLITAVSRRSVWDN